MQNLTVAGRLLITAIVLIGIYFGIRYFTDHRAPAPATTSAVATPADRPSPSATDVAATNEETPPATAPASGERVPFAYSAPEPTGGILRGVVELGASGFNSFIVRTDAQHNWKLNKAEFGNSLVMENMATDEDVRTGLKSYIAKMLDYGVAGKNIHFVVSSGALKAEGTQKIIKQLAKLNYVVNTVTPEKEGVLGLRSVLPPSYAGKAFVADIGSGNTKISWLANGTPKSVETYGAKYFEQGASDATVATEVKAKAEQIPTSLRQTCFIIGGVPFEMAKQVRKGSERYTVLDAPSAYKLDNAKSKAGLNIYRSLAEATGCQQFVFDWDANFTIGYLLTLPQ
ncbi:MAG: hypothetical protein ACRYG7_08360 [Janthinobacterium lividum]